MTPRFYSAFRFVYSREKANAILVDGTCAGDFFANTAFHCEADVSSDRFLSVQDPINPAESINCSAVYARGFAAALQSSIPPVVLIVPEKDHHF